MVGQRAACLACLLVDPKVAMMAVWSVVGRVGKKDARRVVR